MTDSRKGLHRYPFSLARYAWCVGAAFATGCLCGGKYLVSLVYLLHEGRAGASAGLWALGGGLLCFVAVAVALGCGRYLRSKNGWVRADADGISVADAFGRVRALSWDDVASARFYRPRCGFYVANREMIDAPWARVVVRGRTGKLCIRAGLERPDELANAICKKGDLYPPRRLGWISATYRREQPGRPPGNKGRRAKG